ncbi:MAG: hypothetical protein IID59_02885 [Proteobacteria bacterium]|nr:hypothetical protein [Pseudomonadota bacterium]
MSNFIDIMSDQMRGFHAELLSWGYESQETVATKEVDADRPDVSASSR